MLMQELTLNTIMDFTIFGIYTNFFMMLLLYIIRTIKFHSLTVMDKKRIMGFIHEMNSRGRNKSTVVEWFSIMLLFLPMYKAGLSLISIWYTIMYKGANGLALGIIKANNFAIVKR